MFNILPIFIPLLILTISECSSQHEKIFCRVSLSRQSSSMRCSDELSQNSISFIFNVKKMSNYTGSFLNKLKALKFKSYSCENETVFLEKSIRSINRINCSSSNITVGDFEDVIDLSIITELKTSKLADFSLASFPISLRILSIINTDIEYLAENVFSHLHFLNELVLANIKLREVKRDHFQNLKNLTKLDLSNNFIQWIPNDAFNDISELKILNLSGNKIVSIEKLAFQFLTKLKSLDLSSCSLELWDNEMFSYLSSLINLNLSNNNIQNIPVWIFEPLDLLEELNLSKNKIHTIYSRLFRTLKKLENLDLSLNVLEDLSFKSEQLKNLEILNLSGNRINLIFDFLLKNLQNLRLFNISHNALDTLEIYIYVRLNSLEILDASYNNIVEVSYNYLLKDESIYDQEFHGYNNSNSTLGGPLSKLKQINLDHNNLENLDFLRDGFCFFPNNVSISFSHNKISEFNVSLLLDQENYFTQKYNETCNFNNISNIFIDISFNPIDCDCHLYEFHQYLKDSSTLGFYTFRNLQNLKCKTPYFLKNYAVLSVQDEAFSCLFTEECAQNCHCGVRAKDKKIFVNCTKLDFYEVSIVPPEDATILYFNQNHLKDLTSLNNETWTNITDLHMDDNDIGTLDGWNIPPKLQYLSLRGNRLKSISVSLMEFINKQNHFQLLFERNDRNCDCDSALFKRFLINKREFVPDVDKIFCDIEKNGDIYLTPLVSLSEEVLCAEELLSKLTQNALVSFFSTLIILIIIALIIYFKMRMEVHSFIYIHFGHLCCFKSEKNDSEPRTFDAFVAYSSYDQQVVLDLLQELEEKEPRFQLCIHERDWKAGNDIIKNILESVQNSKRTIFVMSENFIASPWFKAELTAATSEGRMNPFIIILVDKSMSLKNMNKHFRRIISKKTYLVWGERWFWEKLRYAMPHKKCDHTATTTV